MIGMHFSKVEGLGNDFLLFDGLEAELPEGLEKKAPQWCDRHFGVGGDGFLLLERSERADFRMRIINSDGSEPEMCGNGIRCAALYAYRKGWVGKEMTVETLAGMMYPRIVEEEEGLVEVDMGQPIWERERIPMRGCGESLDEVEAKGKRFVITGVSMGNPHGVIFAEDTAVMPESYGAVIEQDALFPEKCNVEFAKVESRERIRMRVWERGAGITLACGTGACATAVAAMRRGLCDRCVTVVLDGGELTIQWDENNDHVRMCGKATIVFEGEIGE